TPAASPRRHPRQDGARCGSDPGCASSPTSGAGSVRSQRKSCHYGRRWACARWMLASDVSDGSSSCKPKPIGSAPTAPSNLQRRFRQREHLEGGGRGRVSPQSGVSRTRRDGDVLLTFHLIGDDASGDRAAGVEAIEHAAVAAVESDEVAGKFPGENKS